MHIGGTRQDDAPYVEPLNDIDCSISRQNDVFSTQRHIWVKAALNILTVDVNVFVIGLIMHAHTLKWDCRDLWSDIFSVLSKNSLGGPAVFSH